MERSVNGGRRSRSRPLVYSGACARRAPRLRKGLRPPALIAIGTSRTSFYPSADTGDEGGVPRESRTTEEACPRPAARDQVRRFGWPRSFPPSSSTLGRRQRYPGAAAGGAPRCASCAAREVTGLHLAVKRKDTTWGSSGGTTDSRPLLDDRGCGGDTRPNERSE